jgi:hypothetical protein
MQAAGGRSVSEKAFGYTWLDGFTINPITVFTGRMDTNWI